MPRKKVTNTIDQALDGDPAVGRTLDFLERCAFKEKPKNIEELRQRIFDFFEACKAENRRPAVEILSMTLGVSRTTFWKWCNGIGCDPEWAECCRIAKQMILAFIEQVSLSGKLNPATSIFMLKNWAGYKDTISFDEAQPNLTAETSVPIREIEESVSGLIEKNKTKKTE